MIHILPSHKKFVHICEYIPIEAYGIYTHIDTEKYTYIDREKNQIITKC